MFFGKKPSFEDSFQQLQTQRARLNGIIGGWPTKISTPREGQEVRKLWNEALAQARRLAVEQPSVLEVQLVLADLLRMGHNIDVPGAAQASYDLLQVLCRDNPTRYEPCYTLASLLVILNPDTAPQAESLFLRAETLAAPQIIPDLYQGLGFACVYQDKLPEAIPYFEKYLQLQDDGYIHQVLDALKAGKSRRFFQELPQAAPHEVKNLKLRKQ